MRLYSSTSSPYARKVRLLLAEKGLKQEIEEVVVSPFENRAELLAINPLGQIPVLVLSDGEVIYDSPLICQYVDELSTQNRFIPQQSAKKYTVLRWQALADGLMDAAYNLVMERRRPQTEQSPSMMGDWSGEIVNVLKAMEVKIDELDEQISLAHLAVGAAIGYVDFRLPELLYESTSTCSQPVANSALLRWYEAFKIRPSMQATQPR